MHFCMDEVVALMHSVPFLGLTFRRLHAWWHRVTCPHRQKLFDAFKGHQGTVLMSATPPEEEIKMTPEELDTECKKLDVHFGKEIKNCQHHGSRTSYFAGMDELRALFSGQMSSEEYSKSTGEFGLISHCGECGVRLP